MKLEKRVTLSDVAKDAGVSRATVSLVLRNSPAPAKETVSRVLGSIRRLGYVYNRAAAALRSNRTHSVGLIETNINNTFFAAMSVGAERELEKAGRGVLFANTQEQLDKQRRAINLMLEYNVEGLLICPAKGTTWKDLEILSLHRVPFVLFCRRIPERTDYVGADNETGALLAMRRLLSLGHEHIAFVGGDPALSAWHERTRGVETALGEAGILGKLHCLESEISIGGGFAAAEACLALDPAPTAALCYNDTVAFGFMMGLDRHGVRPGVDFAVVGFDDVEEAAMWKPALTTVASPPEIVGIEAAGLLLRKIDHPENAPVQVSIPARLVIRDSCGGLRRGNSRVAADIGVYNDN